MRSSCNAAQSAASAQHDQDELQTAHSLDFLLGVIPSLLKASVLLSAPVCPSTVLGRWLPNELSSRSSNWAMLSRCRPTCLVSREHDYPPLGQPTFRVCHLCWSAWSRCAILPILSFDQRVLGASTRIQLFRRCLLAELQAVEHLRCLIRIHGSQQQHIRSPVETTTKLLRYPDTHTQKVFVLRSKRTAERNHVSTHQCDESMSHAKKRKLKKITKKNIWEKPVNKSI